MKSLNPPVRQSPFFRALAALILLGLAASPAWAQQFNRSAYTNQIAQSYSPTAAASLGGEAACQVDMYNSCAGANVVQQNSGTGSYWHIVGYYMSTEDPTTLNGGQTVGAVPGYADVTAFAFTTNHAGLIDYVGSYTDESGVSQQPGNVSTVAAATGAYYVVFAHEVGHNFGCNHADGLGGTFPFRTIMLHNYCPNSDINYYSNPSVYYNGVRLLGSLSQDCSTGSFANNGNNAGIITGSAAGKQGSVRPSAVGTNNAIYDWKFTNAPALLSAGTTVTDSFGGVITVRGNGAAYTGTGLRLPGGASGNAAANAIGAYLDLSNGIVSSLTNMTLEIWATPVTASVWERLFSFGEMSGPGDGLGASGEWTGTPGTPAPGATTAVDELALTLCEGTASLATEELNTVTNSVASAINIAATTAPGTLHYYAMTFQDGVGTFGTNGGRIICYRDDDGNPTSHLDVNFHLRNLHDVNNWLGRSQYSPDTMANIEYSEVRISSVALTPQQIYGNYLLGGGNARTIYNPPLTAVHCGGAGVATLAADQRTFAADENFSGGTAWNQNGYSYAIDVSGVTNPAPQTAYQDQRYGNMTYTFTNYLPGTNYLVRLHFSECCWTSAGQRVFNVFINGQEVLTNFDIFAAAGAQNRAVIKEISKPADVNGRITVQFVNVTDNASINAIEILQGGLYVPINLTALPGNAQVTLSWSPVAGATSYNVKRSLISHGTYTTITNVSSTTFSDYPLAGSTPYFYVVSAVNGGNESFNSIEASAVTPVTVNADTWVGGTGNNFSTLANWIYAIGSGPVSNTDALIFDSVGSTTPFNDESSFGYASITYNPAAQSYIISGNPFALGTNSTGLVLTDNSTNAQTINNTVTLVTATPTVSVVSGGTVTFGGAVSGSGVLTKNGPGVLNLGGAANTLTGGVAVNAGTLNFIANAVATSTSTITVGSAANNAVLNIPGGHLTGLNYNIGTVSGAVGAIYQTGGIITGTQAANSTDFQIGNASGAYGYVYVGPGSSMVVNEIGIGGEANSGNAIFDLYGGAVADSGWVVISRAGGAQTGILNIFGGTLKYAGSGVSDCWGTGQTAIVNVMGGFLTNTTDVGINLNRGASTANNTGVLNLLGGVAEGNSVSGTLGQVNFNGGTLKASKTSTTFMTGIGSATIYSGGATIDAGGFVISIAQPLVAPAGKGVYGVASFTGGSGYIAPPIVTINRGSGDTTGAGATAIAQINPATGVVTNVIITSPGTNYTVAPTFTLTGGGATVAATITGQPPVANIGGGLTKIGAGLLVLTNPCTYTGNTLISNGTISLSGSGSIGNSPNIMLAPTTGYSVSSVAGAIVNPAQTISGFGTVSGALTINGAIAPGASPSTIGTLTFNSAPVLNGTVFLKLNRTNAQSSDRFNLSSGTLTFGGTLVVTNVGAQLQVGDTFTLLGAGSYAGSFNTMTLPSLAAGLVWNTNSLAVNGTLAVVANPPVISGSQLAAGAFQFTFSGASGQPYTILSSTDVTAPLTNWTVVATGTFGAGSVAYTNSAPVEAGNFYTVRSP